VGRDLDGHEVRVVRPGHGDQAVGALDAGLLEDVAVGAVARSVSPLKPDPSWSKASGLCR
jgi:hypothetical protein